MKAEILNSLGTVCKVGRYVGTLLYFILCLICLMRC